MLAIGGRVGKIQNQKGNYCQQTTNIVIVNVGKDNGRLITRMAAIVDKTKSIDCS